MRLSHKSHNGDSELTKWRILVVQFIFLFLEMEEGMQNITDYMKQQALLCEKNDDISVDLYSQYGVKRGLRDENGHFSPSRYSNAFISDMFVSPVSTPCPFSSLNPLLTPY